MSKKRKSNFRKQTVNDAKRQRKEASSYGYLNLPKGIKPFTLKEKTRDILLDFIPYVVTDSHHPDRDVDESRAIVDSLWYKRPFKVHRNVGVDNETVVCLTSVKKKCPICEFVAEQRRKGKDWEEIKDTIAKDRNLYAVIPIDSENHDDIIHVWDVSWFLFQNELNEQLEEEPDNGIFPALEEGLTLDVKFRWKKFGKNLFPETRDIDFKERDEQYDEKILDDVPNLDEMLNVLSYKELEAKFLELDDEEPAEEIADEHPSSTQRRKTSESEIEKEDVDEKPSRRKRRGPEEKEDTDEKPKRSRRVRAEEQEENKCPHGFEFGAKKDCEKHDECDKCEVWDDCVDEMEKK